jgi:uncharacterized protein YbbC (DUF1343 family)
LKSLSTPFTNGIEWLYRNPERSNSWGRCGLLINQASINLKFQPSWKLLQEILGTRLTCLFGPQHGFAGTAQDNMIETNHSTHLATGLPVFSLYSETRRPTESMFSYLDTLVIDLQIVGCRIYTWKSTIAECLRSAKEFGKRVVILDRPNPLGGEVLEGRVLDDDAQSFVGQFKMPMRHGLTPGEAALFFNSMIGADLEVIPMKDWDPQSYWCDLERPWVLTSPNLPTMDAVYVYPGTVLLEGTNLSEGRGTSLPFQLIGAPYIPSGQKLISLIERYPTVTEGVVLREAAFEPTAQKWQGQVCNGLQIHVENSKAIRSFKFTLALIKSCIDLSDQFAWRQPPYEYDFTTLPIKLIVGSHKVTDFINLKYFDLSDSFWEEGIREYIETVRRFLIYPRNSFGTQ